MHYEINVSRGNQHFFATHPRSIQTMNQAIVVATALRDAFPTDKGWKVDITRHDTLINEVTLTELKAE